MYLWFFVLYRDEPLLYLNYAIALYNSGDAKGSAVQYRKYQSKSRSLEEEDPDPEVQWFLILIKFDSIW